MKPYLPFVFAGAFLYSAFNADAYFSILRPARESQRQPIPVRQVYQPKSPIIAQKREKLVTRPEEGDSLTHDNDYYRAEAGGNFGKGWTGLRGLLAIRKLPMSRHTKLF